MNNQSKKVLITIKMCGLIKIEKYQSNIPTTTAAKQKSAQKNNEDVSRCGDS